MHTLEVEHLHALKKKNKKEPGVMAYTYNPSYLGGRMRRIVV
jgi:hypothetical protein